jgi:hypothetical protein
MKGVAGLCGCVRGFEVACFLTESQNCRCAMSAMALPWSAVMATGGEGGGGGAGGEGGGGGRGEGGGEGGGDRPLRRTKNSSPSVSSLVSASSNGPWLHSGRDWYVCSGWHDWPSGALRQHCTLSSSGKVFLSRSEQRAE